MLPGLEGPRSPALVWLLWVAVVDPGRGGDEIFFQNFDLVCQNGKPIFFLGIFCWRPPYRRFHLHEQDIVAQEHLPLGGVLGQQAPKGCGHLGPGP